MKKQDFLLSTQAVDNIYKIKQLLQEKETKNNVSLLQIVGLGVDIEVIKYFVEEHDFQITPDCLDKAINTQQLEAVKYFIAKGLIVEDSHLSLAIKLDGYEIFQALLNKHDTQSMYLMYIAANLGRMQMLKDLLEKNEYMSPRLLEKIAFYSINGGHLELVKYFVEEKRVEVVSEMLEAAIISSHIDIADYCLHNGCKMTQEILINVIKKADITMANYAITKLQGHNQINLQDGKILFSLLGKKESLELLIKQNNISQDKLAEIFVDAVLKGNYDLASAIDQMFNFCMEHDIIEEVESAIKIGLLNSIENNKYHAILNLLYRSGIAIPEKYQHLIKNINDDISYQEFDFINDMLKQLARYYLDLTQYKMTNTLLAEFEQQEDGLFNFNYQTISDNENKILKVKEIINHIFDPETPTRLQSFIKLKELLPNNQYLEKITTEFDAYYQVIGSSLNLLDKDFSLEVLTINGVKMPDIKESLTLYRGFISNMDTDRIEAFFKYGTRSFGMGEMQKILGFHVNEKWNEIKPYQNHFWQYGGTYLTFDPQTAANYAGGLKDNELRAEEIMLEIKLSPDAPLVCGKYTELYEVIAGHIDGSDVTAIYKLENRNFTVREVYKNPYINEEILPRYHVGEYIERDEKTIGEYNLLDCQIVRYNDYQDFCTRYEYADNALNPYFEDRPMYGEFMS